MGRGHGADKKKARSANAPGFLPSDRRRRDAYQKKS